MQNRKRENPNSCYNCPHTQCPLYNSPDAELKSIYCKRPGYVQLLAQLIAETNRLFGFLAGEAMPAPTEPQEELSLARCLVLAKIYSDPSRN